MQIFDNLLAQYNNDIFNWEVIAINIAHDLFMLLAVIQIIWAGIVWMLNRDDPTNLMVEFAKKILVLSFFLMVIDHADTWIPAIYNSLREAGEQMVGVSQLYPGDVARRGVDLASTMLTTSFAGGLLEKVGAAIFNVIVALLVFLSFLLISIEMALTLIGGKIILAGGIVVLGFAGSQWTRQFAERYFVTAVHIGLKLLFLTLIVGLGETLTTNWINVVKNAQGNLFESYFSILAASLTYLFMALKVPDMGASLLTGSINMNFGHGIGTIAAGTALGGLYGARTLIHSTTGAARETVGAGAAVYEATKVGVAKAQMTPGATPIGKIGIATGTTIKTLASAAGSQFKERMQASISRTGGGKVANYIKTLSAGAGLGRGTRRGLNTGDNHGNTK